MSAESLCEACKDLLQRIRKKHGQHSIWFTHHSTAESFVLAIELECPLCIRLMTAFYDRGKEDLEVAPTSYFFAPIHLPMNYSSSSGHLPTVQLHHDIIFLLGLNSKEETQITLRLLPWTGKH
jgi:hypothetical protein